MNHLLECEETIIDIMVHRSGIRVCTANSLDSLADMITEEDEGSLDCMESDRLTVWWNPSAMVLTLPSRRYYDELVKEKSAKTLRPTSLRPTSDRFALVAVKSASLINNLHDYRNLVGCVVVQYTGGKRHLISGRGRLPQTQSLSNSNTATASPLGNSS
eukprot:GHVH01007005.1.p1 GENE.GHVH01007005.1~~GHVH01007005.1.p1  ORF type:complete len:159 (+),score=16.13 GHVH01007005.1:221-697(+)